MVKQKSHQVVPNPDSGWDVKKAGSERASPHSNTKQDEVKGRQISQNQATERCFHGKDGKIQQKDSQRNNPYPPVG